MATSKNSLQNVLELAGSFVTGQKGTWGHEEWETLLSKAAAQGIAVTDETKRNLGNILEASKYFYNLAPAKAPARKAAAKKPAPAKPAAKPKAAR